jgi:hypothetical protein
MAKAKAAAIADGVPMDSFSGVILVMNVAVGISDGGVN